MNYFVTGATGFIGRYLVENLLKRDGKVYVLLRKGSEEKLATLKEKVNDSEDRITPIYGNLREEFLGINEKDTALLKGKIGHFFHLAAIYDLAATEEDQQSTNVEGTRQASLFAEQIQAKCFHLASSIAVAGLYPGVFREDMFEEAENLNNPYLRTKHLAELQIREECKIPYRIYRPGMVVGHSKTGEIDKIDGPYYLFKMIQKLRKMLPSWMPTVGIEGGRINIVPVDFVADAMDHIAHKKDLDGETFHLTDPFPHTVGEVLNIFAKAGHAPEFAMRLNASMFGFIPPFLLNGLKNLPPIQRITEQLLKDLAIPSEVTQFINYPTRFDNREAERALRDSGIEVPPLQDYANNIWDYWERNLDPSLFMDRSLSGSVKGKTVVVTGASSGIGLATAIQLGHAGAKVLLVARGEEKLLETKAEIDGLGGEAYIYTCDLSDQTSCDALVESIISDHGTVDIVVNNAGRSIRRSISSSYDRFHDFERTMQLNYFGALKMIMGFLPHMNQQGGGQFINISSIGVLTNAPRFSAYVASKAALDAFTRCAASEFSDHNIHFTTINMPLVKTPMIAPTKIYDSVPTITPDEAADMIAEAIIYKPKRIATRLGIFAQALYAIAPKITEIIMNTGFKMFPESEAASGKKQLESTSEQVAFAHLLRGIHW